MLKQVQIASLEKKFDWHRNKIGKRAEKILKILEKKDVAVEIFLAGNKEMRQLNKIYRQKDKAANVLSFEEPKNFPRPEIKGKIKAIGEIFLNLDACRPSFAKASEGKQKKSEKIDWNEVDKLIVHGLLHLSGYDHKKNVDAVKMEKKEKRILSKLSN